MLLTHSSAYDDGAASFPGICMDMLRFFTLCLMEQGTCDYLHVAHQLKAGEFEAHRSVRGPVNNLRRIWPHLRKRSIGLSTSPSMLALMSHHLGHAHRLSSVRSADLLDQLARRVAL